MAIALRTRAANPARVQAFEHRKSASSGFVDLDSQVREPIIAGHDVGTPAIGPDAERDDRRVLEEEQQVGHAARAALLNQSPLHRQSFAVPNQTQAPHFELPHAKDTGGSHTWLGAKSSICFLISDMN